MYDHLAPLFTELATLPEHSPRHAELREHLITEHLPVARNIANRFRNRNESLEDLTQVASVGLVKAIDRFDPSHGSDFMSFAVPTMLGEVRRHFREAAWAMRVPRPLKERHAQIGSTSVALSQELGRAPTPSEIAARLEISTAAVIEGLQVANAQHSSSLDEMLQADGDTSLGQTLGDEDLALIGVEDRETLRPLLDELGANERQVLIMRFFKSYTQTQIAERIGVSQMQVSRMLAKTLKRLREGMQSV
ncbi:MAG: SigB/SigF/SigG family RNA polymerase sigma factor [Sciscionella sp.]